MWKKYILEEDPIKEDVLNENVEYNELCFDQFKEDLIYNFDDILIEMERI